MPTLPHLITLLWGRRSPSVAAAYRDAFARDSLLRRDLAIFCNAAAPITGASEFDRGVEEGKRRVWLHVARLSALEPQDFVTITDGDHTDD
jgi:hypothetical protein